MVAPARLFFPTDHQVPLEISGCEGSFHCFPEEPTVKDSPLLVIASIELDHHYPSRYQSTGQNNESHPKAVSDVMTEEREHAWS